MSKPVVENNVPIYPAYKNGEYVGVIDVLKGDPGRESAPGYEYWSTTVALDHRFDDDLLIAAWISDFKARHKIPSRPPLAPPDSGGCRQLNDLI